MSGPRVLIPDFPSDKHKWRLVAVPPFASTHYRESLTVQPCISKDADQHSNIYRKTTLPDLPNETLLDMTTYMSEVVVYSLLNLPSALYATRRQKAPIYFR